MYSIIRNWLSSSRDDVGSSMMRISGGLIRTRLKRLAAQRPIDAPLFLNRRGEALTRYGVHTLIERYVAKIETAMPSLGAKKISPHVIRHTTATHLLQAGVDINTIRAWLGHVSIDTTSIYAETDLATKKRALATLDRGSPNP